MNPSPPFPLRRKGVAAAAAFLLVIATAGCPRIWNAGDLAVWVEDQAVDQGCRRETIELEDWYTPTEQGNVWHGTCRTAGGEAKAFGIDVDPVWTPSAPPPGPEAPAPAPSGKPPQ